MYINSTGGDSDGYTIVTVTTRRWNRENELLQNSGLKDSSGLTFAPLLWPSYVIGQAIIYFHPVVSSFFFFLFFLA